MTGKAAIAQILKLEGTEYLFCFPANTLIDACAAEGIRPILTRTERTLVNMADGYSRATNGRHPRHSASESPSQVHICRWTSCIVSSLSPSACLSRA